MPAVESLTYEILAKKSTEELSLMKLGNVVKVYRKIDSWYQN